MNYQLQGQLDKAQEVYEEALTIEVHLSSKIDKVRLLIFYGDLLYQKKDYKKSKDYLLKAIEIIEQSDTIFFYEEACELLYKVENASKNYKSALSYFELLSEHKEEIYTKEIEHKISVLMADFNHKQLEQEKEIFKLRNVELKATKEEADKANKAKSIFLANMSHELRSPLNAILGFSQILSRNNDLSTECIDQVRIIQNSGEHLLNLINQVLSLSKIEAGKTALNKKSFDLYKMLEELNEMFIPNIENKDIKLNIHKDENLQQFIYGDELKIRQIIINILNNAIKFTKKGSIELNASSSYDNETSQEILSFKVKDTGVGIDSREQEKIFEPFDQAETGKDKIGGTGLGLSICREFVHLMSGEISVESAPGKGSLFSFYISVEKGEKSGLVETGKGKQVVGIKDGDKPRILVVDDLLDNRLLLFNLLDQVGFDVKTAKNGQIAIQIQKEWQPHLIWMDIRMPVMDGVEATRIIRQSESVEEPVIIAVTASILDNEKENIILKGADDIVQKPFEESTIFSKIGEYLGVEYIYKDVDEIIQKQDEEPQISNEKIKIYFQGFSREILEDFKEALEYCDDDKIELVLQEIKNQNNKLFDLVKPLINSFKYDEIIVIIQEVL